MTDNNEPAAVPSMPPGAMEQLWDERYADSGTVWSGEPNEALVVEARSMVPARALDVGCGEGADAVWLARQGWDVTALDISGVAVRRAEQAADAAGVKVRFLHSGLVEAQLPAAGYEFVAALYPAFMMTADHEAERALLAAVAPGGTLLFVHHAQFGTPESPGEESPGHGHDHHRAAGPGQGPGNGAGITPRDLVGVADVRAFVESVGAEWAIETYEQRTRDIHGGAGAHHTEDVVLRARRLP
ncbi:MAG: class I SAM-dependent methyltransferase [Candidatus Nanopelagicales bacterium]